MATSPQSFTLDRSIFNESLYSSMRDFWFSGIPEGTIVPTQEMGKRWFGVTQTQEEREQFDRECHGNFGHALEALGPENLALPAFKSYEDDVENAATLSAPLLAEVKEAQNQGAKKGSQTLLSLLLLLDQMPRNIYRDPAGLRLVFTHYDRLSVSLLRSSMKLSPNPLDHESVKNRPVFMSWYLLPLMHSEHLPSHELFMEVTVGIRDALKEAGNNEAVEYMENNMEFEAKHVEPLKKFGRYPHRNNALGRENTKEEEEYLESGETFGVKQQENTGKEDDKKKFEKSEL